MSLGKKEVPAEGKRVFMGRRNGLDRAETSENILLGPMSLNKVEGTLSAKMKN